ncbi:MAG: BREX system P-loop protein BrxC, partial [Nitrospiraceae bacterium]|nr:BREX system P-loop protein BrxC [Nitrospiraceae bacterium]
MEKIGELFQKDVSRRIEEVIKVGQDDEETVKNEIEEYIVTDSIRDYYRRVLDEYNSGRIDPSEGIGIWVSGFFGSGKSSFAKILGYILSAKKVMGRNTAELFAERTQDETIKDLLEVINSTIPTHAVIFDVSEERCAKKSTERMTEILYKVLLRELGYSEDFDLAELEIDLEGRGELEEFVELYEKTYIKHPWKKAKKFGRAISEASRILHEMDSVTYPHADSWSNSLGKGGRADITPNLLAERSFELMARRRKDQALIFVIDEVGQYISRSVDKMLDLQAVVQAFGRDSKNRVKAGKAIAPTWIIVTSQEKLDEIVSSLDSKKIEMARLKDRFPIMIDLAPADIADITAKRVLQKTPAAEKVLSDLFDSVEGRLNTNCNLERTSMKSAVTKQDFINFYPYLPHYIDLSIDIMSGIRLQPGAQRDSGGSNRTIIKQAQQMLVSKKVNLAEQTLGRLVTMDKIYDLVEGNLTTEKRKDIADIGNDFSDKPFYLKVAKAICLLEFPRKLPRTPKNIAAVLCNDISGESTQPQVEEALRSLESANYIKATVEGYKLQTSQEKTWEEERRGFAPKPVNRNEIKRNILDEIFDHKVRTYVRGSKTFKVGLVVDEVKIKAEGDVPIQAIVAEDADDFKAKSKKARAESREPTKKNDIYLIFTLSGEIHKRIEELHRSDEMIGKYGRVAAQGKIDPERSSSLEDEKRRQDSIHRELKAKFGQVISDGAIYFRGVKSDNSGLGKDLPEILRSFLDRNIMDLYPKLEMGAVKLKGDEPEKILTAVNLNGLPQVFYDRVGDLGLVIKQDERYVLTSSAPIAKELLDYITNKHSYGGKVTGKDIENHFGGFGYGWERDVLRVVLAALFRGGVIEVTYQGRRYTSYSDSESRQPFVKNIAFKAASFAPSKPIDLKILTDAARNYEEITGSDVNVEKEAIAHAFKKLVKDEKEKLTPIRATIRAENLPGIDFVGEYAKYLEGVLGSDPEDCVTTMASDGFSFKEDMGKLKKIGEVITGSSLEILRTARIALKQKYPVLATRRAEDTELKECGNDLGDFLNAETFYERISEIARIEKEISRRYGEEYLTLHQERAEIYQQVIDEIKGHVDWMNITKERQNVILSPIVSHVCVEAEGGKEYDIPFDPTGVSCSRCHASIGQMESDITAAQALKS